MESTAETQVMIVGGGPVGLTLAMDLASRGIEVIVAETRAPGDPAPVKCNHVSARSMEIFRRLGVAREIRGAGLPDDYPNDCAYRTSFLGAELCRIKIPSRKDRYTAKNGPDGWWPTPEPPHRVNQIYLEPVLFDHASRMPRLTILSRCEAIDFKQDEAGVITSVLNLDTGAEFKISSQYLIGCDGGRSRVRRQIGAKLSGDAVVQRVQSTYIRAPELLRELNAEPAWATFALNPRRSGNVYAIDGRETWLIHNYLKASESSFDSVDRDWAIRTILGVGPEFEYEVLGKEDWVGRRLVADKFRVGRVFICGDSAHIWVPYAGYGMNAGIADATNLAWLMAAHLNGWAPPAILDGYELERLPITEQVSRFAMNHAEQMMKQRTAVPDEIEDDSSQGEAARQKLGREAYELNVRQYCCGGLNFGYFYPNSPLIAYDEEPAPGYTMSDFTPSTVPGCRTPHFWLEDGRSLYDAMGPDYCLLRFDTHLDVSDLVNAARTAGVPLNVLDVDPSLRPASYRHSLLLSRPDQHVAWRGDGVPPGATALIDVIRGAAAPSEDEASYESVHTYGA